MSVTDQIIPYVSCVRSRISSFILRREYRYSELKDEEEEKEEKGKTKEKEEVKDEKGEKKEKERVEVEM